MRNTLSRKIPNKDFVKKEKRSVPKLRPITIDNVLYYYKGSKLYNSKGVYLGNIIIHGMTPKRLATYIKIMDGCFPKNYPRLYYWRNCPTKLTF